MICRYKDEKTQVTAMKRYLDEEFYADLRDNVLALEDARSFFYRDILTQQL